MVGGSGSGRWESRGRGVGRARVFEMSSGYRCSGDKEDEEEERCLVSSMGLKSSNDDRGPADRAWRESGGWRVASGTARAASGSWLFNVHLAVQAWHVPLRRLCNVPYVGFRYHQSLPHVHLMLCYDPPLAHVKPPRANPGRAIDPSLRCPTHATERHAAPRYTLSAHKASAPPRTRLPSDTATVSPPPISRRPGPKHPRCPPHPRPDATEGVPLIPHPHADHRSDTRRAEGDQADHPYSLSWGKGG